MSFKHSTGIELGGIPSGLSPKITPASPDDGLGPANTQSFLLDGVNEHISIPVAAAIGSGVTGDMSVFAWTRTSTAQNTVVFSHWDDSTNRKWELGVTTVSTGIRGRLSQIGSTLTHNHSSLTFSPFDGAWHLIGMTLDVSADEANEFFLNRDGTEVAQDIGSGPHTNMTSMFNSTADLLIGARNPGTPAAFFNGEIFQITMWDAKFTNANISALYNSGTPIDPTTHTLSSNLIGWWEPGSFPNVVDRVNGNDGTAVNMEAGDFQSVTP